MSFLYCGYKNPDIYLYESLILQEEDIMVFMEWSDELSVGIKAIDTQHKVLVKYINDLDDAIKANKGRGELGNIITGLVDYTVRHFDYEEFQFKKHDYSNTEEHVKEHEKLKATVMEFKNKFENQNLDIGDDVMQFLKGWLINHIMKTDKDYSAHLSAHLV